MSCAMCEWFYRDVYDEYVGCVLNGPVGDGCEDYELKSDFRDEWCPQIEVAEMMLDQDEEDDEWL